jgi:hypothetical protein
MARSRSLTMVGLVTGAIVGSWTTAGSSSAPAAATGAGLTYGGRLGGGNDVWLRLRPDRHRIVSLLIEWSVPASMCTKPDVAEEYRSSSTWTGSEAGHPIDVRNGRLVARASDAYSYGPYSFVEKVRITGVFVSQRVEGTLDVNLVATNRDGAGGFSCTLVRKRWTAVD